MVDTIHQSASAAVAPAGLPPELRWAAGLWPAAGTAGNRLGLAAAVLVATVSATELLGATGAAVVLLPTLMVAYSAWLAGASTAVDRASIERAEASNASLRRSILGGLADLVGAARAEQAALSTGAAAATRTALEIALLEGWGAEMR